MTIPTIAPFSLDDPEDVKPAIAPARAGTAKKITRSIGWKFDSGSSDAKTTKRVPDSIPTRIERSRCWNLAVADAIDCSIRIGFQRSFCSYLLLLWKTKKVEKTQIYRKKYIASNLDRHELARNNQGGLSRFQSLDWFIERSI